MKCDICNKGRLISHVDKMEVDYKGIADEIDFHFSECDSCGSTIADHESVLANKRSMIAFRKRVDGLLDGESIRDIRKKYGINQQEAADIFGGGLTAFSKYENNDISQSRAMDRLLRVANAVPSAFDWLSDHITTGMQTIDLGSHDWETSRIIHLRKTKVVAVRVPKTVCNEPGYEDGPENKMTCAQ